MSRLKALVVDDASFVRDLVKRTVRSDFPQIELHEAADGRKAQGMLAREAFDLVLCDWEMPEISGLELLQWVRQQKEGSNLPFVMVTSRGDRENLVEAIREGVSDYLSKPFSPEALAKKIRKVLGNRLGGDSGGGEKSKDAFRQSADLLTGGAGAQEKKLSGTAEIPREKPKREAPTRGPEDKASGSGEPTMASIRFSGSTLQSVVRAITLNEIRVTARRTETFPGILEQAVVDIDLRNDKDKVARLNGYVHMMQAMEQRQDSDFVQLTVRFVDDDPAKMEDLTHFIARFHGRGAPAENGR